MGKQLETQKGYRKWRLSCPPTQSRLQAGRLGGAQHGHQGSSFHPRPVIATCKMFSVLSICPTSISTHPPLQSPKNALSKFQWDRSRRWHSPKGLPAPGIKPPIRRAQCDQLCLFSIHTHSVPISALGPAVLCLCPHLLMLPTHPNLSQAHLPSWGSAWLLLKVPDSSGWELLSGLCMLLCQHCWKNSICPPKACDPGAGLGQS